MVVDGFSFYRKKFASSDRHCEATTYLGGIGKWLALCWFFEKGVVVVEALKKRLVTNLPSLFPQSQAQN